MNGPMTPLERTIQSASAEAAAGIARIEAKATNTPAARALYQARIPIHPKLVHGNFRTLKWGLMAVMLAIYYGVPWLRWPRGVGVPDQAVLVDVANGRFFFFAYEFWPQEVIFITGLLIMAALGLFLVTALFGRVWCGYACPQTIWTDLFILVERAFEGDRAARIRMDKAPWSGQKLARKFGKHTIWLAIAAATGGAWIFYFHDAPTLLGQLFTGDAPLVAYAFLGLLTFTTYALAGTMREQVCTYMCPWPRIQAALIDEETLQVTYRHDRGEPRGAHKKGQPWEGRGHCIDCNQCVAACPMGIDIRDGMQLECINCALCIDACDDVMTRIGLPRGLIAYDNDLNVARRAKGQSAHWKFLRSRTVLYAFVLAAVAGLMILGLSGRTDLDVSVLRDRNPNFVMLADGQVRNGYTIKFVNKAPAMRLLTLEVSAPVTADIRIIGAIEGSRQIEVAPGRVRAIRMFVTLDPARADTSQWPITVRVSDQKGTPSHEIQSIFVTGKNPP